MALPFNTEDLIAQRARTQRAFLDALSASLGSPVPTPPKPIDTPVSAPNTSSPYVWTEEQVQRLVQGRVSDVLGASYQNRDEVPVRLRPPQPPFLFVSRVLQMTAQKDHLAPCLIEWEYDFPHDAWYLNQDQVPSVISLESGHALVFLLMVMGCDQLFNQNARFRFLNTQQTQHHRPPRAGDRFRGIAEITSIVKSKQMILLQITGKGFLNDQLLSTGTSQSVLLSADTLAHQTDNPPPVAFTKAPNPKTFTPLLNCEKSQFEKADITALQQGAFNTCFGPEYTTLKPNALSGDGFLLLDRITSITTSGGPYGLGEVVGEKTLDDSVRWVFNAHFKDDPVYPGIFGLEGCNQTLLFFSYYIGLHKGLKDFQVIPEQGTETKARFLSEIKPTETSVQYQLAIKEIISGPQPIIRAEALVVCNGRTVTQCTLSLQYQPIAQTKTEKQTKPFPGAMTTEQIQSNLLNFKTAFWIRQHNTDIALDQSVEQPHDAVGLLPAFEPSQFGSVSFRQDHGTQYAYMAGAMANGIASEDFVIALGKAGFLSSFGAAGLSLERTRAAIQKIQTALPDGPFACNLIFSPMEPKKEFETAQLYVEMGVRTIEASAFFNMTRSIVYYRVSGLTQDANGGVKPKHRIIAKLSRLELSDLFMQPAPPKIVSQLLQEGFITEAQAEMAKQVPMADDITVEADSGGHTDNRPLNSTFPLIANRVRSKQIARDTHPIRVGAAGGIGTPSAIISAFMMGADYVVTGSINQASVESGTSTTVKKMLTKADTTDIMMAPSSDMFELGVNVQVLKRGTQFPLKARKLFEYFQQYESIEDLTPADKDYLEQHIFKRTISDVWQDTIVFFQRRNPTHITTAEKNPKKKMALIFRWYLGRSSSWAVREIPDRIGDYQVWCGPAMGAFNAWVQDSYLTTPENRHAVDMAHHLMQGATFEYRKQFLNGRLNEAQLRALNYPLSPRNT